MKSIGRLLGLDALWESAWAFMRQAAGYLPRVILLLVLFVAVYLLLRLVLLRIERYVLHRILGRQALPREQEKRIQTLTQIMNKVIYVLFWGIVFTILLGQFGVDIGPIVAAAGIAGLALSFGAQSLVRDIISGVFILAENQVRIGDVAVVNGTGGLVEAINLRTIVLRDLAGAVHVFPNGAITTLSNLTKDWSGYVFNLGIDHREDPDRAIAVIRQVADGLLQDERFAGKILEPAEIFGLDRFEGSLLYIQGRIKTQPIEQWGVGREFNRRIQRAFLAQGIRFTLPEQMVRFATAQDPLRVLFRREAGGRGPGEREPERREAGGRGPGDPEPERREPGEGGPVEPGPLPPGP
jgi:small conductance mechanosensitive channel